MRALFASPNAGWAELIPFFVMFVFFVAVMIAGAVGTILFCRFMRFKVKPGEVVLWVSFAAVLGACQLPQAFIFCSSGGFLLWGTEWPVSAGMTREEVIAAIGKPHRIEPDYPSMGFETWAYYIAPFGTTSVHVEFDENHRVSGTWEHNQFWADEKGTRLGRGSFPLAHALGTS